MVAAAEATVLLSMWKIGCSGGKKEKFVCLMAAILVSIKT